MLSKFFFTYWQTIHSKLSRLKMKKKSSFHFHMIKLLQLNNFYQAFLYSQVLSNFLQIKLAIINFKFWLILWLFQFCKKGGKVQINVEIMECQILRMPNGKSYFFTGNRIDTFAIKNQPYSISCQRYPFYHHTECVTDLY